MCELPLSFLVQRLRARSSASAATGAGHGSAARELLAIERTFPARHDDRRDGVADEIGQRAAFAT